MDLNCVGSLTHEGFISSDTMNRIYRTDWASLVAQLVKNPPTMQETWVRFLGWEDSLEKR